MGTVQRCSCGWERPLIAVTLADGSRPTEDYRVLYACPSCGRVHHCTEVPPPADTERFVRADLES